MVAVPPGTGRGPGWTIALDTRNVWRVGWIVVAVVALTALGRFVLADGGSPRSRWSRPSSGSPGSSRGRRRPR